MRTASEIRKEPQFFSEDTITVRGETGTFSVACSDRGTGPAVVLLHCNASSRHQWRPLMDDLSARCRVLAVDLIGHGDSPLPSRPAPFSVADEVAMVAALIQRAGEPVHLVGHSYGGAIALKAALALQRDVLSLTLIEPASFELLRHAGEREAWAEIRAVACRHVALVRQGAPERAADVFMGYWIGEAAWQSMPEARRAAVCATMPAVARAWEVILGERTGVADYAGLDVPTLLIRGGSTHAPCTRVVERLHAALPHARLTTIDGAGHMAPITHAEPVNALIATHLDCAARVTFDPSRQCAQDQGRPAAARAQSGQLRPAAGWGPAGMAAAAPQPA